MSVDAMKVAQAYLQAAKSGAGVSKGDEVASGPSFADMVKDSVGDLTETLKTSEQQSVNAVNDEAQMVDVVTAIAEAEVTLQTVVAVRDKVISAYQEILRMPI